jgi:cysteinyl-tRNA synthetase
MQAARQDFLDAMDDDFNTAGALGHLFDLVRAINTARDSGAPAPVLAEAQSLLSELMSVLGLRTERAKGETAQAAPFIDLLVQIRRELRQAKQYALADSIRTRLVELGVTLEDTRDGTLWKLE